MTLEDGRFAACQVIGVWGPNKVKVTALDWLGDKPPTRADLTDAKSLIVDHHSWSGRPELCIVEGPPPPEWLALGVRESLVECEDPYSDYAAWDRVKIHVLAQYAWNHIVPAAEVAAYKLAHRHARDSVRVEIGSGFEAERGTSEACIGRAEEFIVAPDESVAWAALDALGQLTVIDYEGRDAGVLAYVGGRALIAELRWRGHAQARIDLTGTGLTRLVVEVGEGPLELHLTDELRMLALLGYRGQALRVHHPRAGAGLTLELGDLCVGDSVPPAVAGLERLTSLSIAKPRAVDIAALGYPALENVAISCNVGRLDHLETLAEWTSLRRLELHDVYEFDAATFPSPSAIPTLVGVSVDGLRKADATTLKRRLAGLARLELRGAKTDAWLAANAHNPFNDWVDESPSLGKAACKAYNASAARIAALAPGDQAALHAELLGFVAAFNTINDKHGLDSVHSEQIHEVYHQLAGPSEVGGQTLDEWFDELIEF